MANCLLRTPLRVSGLRLATLLSARGVGTSTNTFIRQKATLPDLTYGYGELEPSISGQIMELHHDKHHATYVNSYNTAAKKLQEAEKSGDVKTTVGLQALINFHGGGHINHSLFWENLAPKNKGGGEPPKGELSKTIDESYGSLENLKKQFNAALAGIQGSGWGWLVKDTQTGKIGIKTYANQDPVVGQFKPLLGIDAWEHSYYLQYQNRKAEYFGAIWDVINWKSVEKRFA